MHYWRELTEVKSVLSIEPQIKPPFRFRRVKTPQNPSKAKGEKENSNRGGVVFSLSGWTHRQSLCYEASKLVLLVCICCCLASALLIKYASTFSYIRSRVGLFHSDHWWREKEKEGRKTSVSKPPHPYWLNKFATNHFTNAQWGAIEVGGNTPFMLCPPPQGRSLDSWLV